MSKWRRGQREDRDKRRGADGNVATGEQTDLWKLPPQPAATFNLSTEAKEPSVRGTTDPTGRSRCLPTLKPGSA